MHENFLSIFNQKLGDKKQQLRKSEEKKRIIFISLLQSTTLFIYITLTKVIWLQNSVFSPFAHHKKRCGLRQ